MKDNTIGYELKKYLQTNGINKIIDDLDKFVNDNMQKDYSNHGKTMSHLFEKLQDDYAKNITPAVCLASNPNIDKNDPKEIREVIRYHIQTANSQYDEDDGHFQGNSFEQRDIQFLRKAIKSIKSESQRIKTFAKDKTNEMTM